MLWKKNVKMNKYSIYGDFHHDYYTAKLWYILTMHSESLSATKFKQNSSPELNAAGNALEIVLA